MTTALHTNSLVVSPLGLPAQRTVFCLRPCTQRQQSRPLLLEKLPCGVGGSPRRVFLCAGAKRDSISAAKRDSKTAVATSRPTVVDAEVVIEEPRVDSHPAQKLLLGLVKGLAVAALAVGLVRLPSAVLACCAYSYHVLTYYASRSGVAFKIIVI